ncbi:MAG TPA: hypothetical protein VGJ68_12175 [Bradyrhizobium sp.]
MRQPIAKPQPNRGCRDQRNHGMTKKAAAIHSDGPHGLFSNALRSVFPDTAGD